MLHVDEGLAQRRKVEPQVRRHVALAQLLHHCADHCAPSRPALVQHLEHCLADQGEHALRCQRRNRHEKVGDQVQRLHVAVQFHCLQRRRSRHVPSGHKRLLRLPNPLERGLRLGRKVLHHQFAQIERGDPGQRVQRRPAQLWLETLEHVARAPEGGHPQGEAEGRQPGLKPLLLQQALHPRVQRVLLRQQHLHLGHHLVTQRKQVLGPLVQRGQLRLLRRLEALRFAHQRRHAPQQHHHERGQALHGDGRVQQRQRRLSVPLLLHARQRGSQ
mmetsp:Transcript_28994/g.94477  ORF Transcript_28994/g.94477 Transcript_28994/m.94477 type:complete len:273 (+) Transcript_28994:890-1708(+)